MNTRTMLGRGPCAALALAVAFATQALAVNLPVVAPARVGMSGERLAYIGAKFGSATITV